MAFSYLVGQDVGIRRLVSSANVYLRGNTLPADTNAVLARQISRYEFNLLRPRGFITAGTIARTPRGWMRRLRRDGVTRLRTVDMGPAAACKIRGPLGTYPAVRANLYVLCEGPRATLCEPMWQQSWTNVAGARRGTWTARFDAADVFPDDIPFVVDAPSLNSAEDTLRAALTAFLAFASAKYDTTNVGRFQVKALAILDGAAFQPLFPSIVSSQAQRLIAAADYAGLALHGGNGSWDDAFDYDRVANAEPLALAQHLSRACSSAAYAVQDSA